MCAVPGFVWACPSLGRRGGLGGVAAAAAAAAAVVALPPPALPLVLSRSAGEVGREIARDDDLHSTPGGFFFVSLSFSVFPEGVFRDLDGKERKGIWDSVLPWPARLTWYTGKRAYQIASASASSTMRSKRAWMLGVMPAPKMPGRIPAWKAGRSVIRPGRTEDQSSRLGAVGLEGVARGRGRAGPIQSMPLHVERMRGEAW